MTAAGGGDRADVVVVGGGPGGCAAALEAARAGASVVLLEALGVVGGNAARSTGYMAFADFDAQHAAGISDDSPEAYLADMVAEAALQERRFGVIFDTDLARRYAEQSAAAYRFLVDLGFGFGRFVPRPRQHRIDRMMDVADVGMFNHLFATALAEAGVDVRHSVRARRLHTQSRHVTGVEYESVANTAAPAIAAGTTGAGPLGTAAETNTAPTAADGTTSAACSPRSDEDAPDNAPGADSSHGSGAGGHSHVLSAGGGVILAAGGYQANHELRARYQPGHLATTPYLGVDTGRGDGHLMGSAVGGDLINMTMIPPLVMVASALVEDSIAVDTAGKRFHDEAGPYHERVAALEATADGRAYYIFDDRVHRLRHDLIAQMPEKAVSAGSVGELAGMIGCPADTLEATVGEWNATVTSPAARDPAFGRVVFGKPRVGIAEPPLWAVPMVVGINFPAGGFRVSLDCEVFDVFGELIPGLYAVGDCTGGIAAAIGLGGVKISSAVTLGRIAGKAAAARARATAPAA